jgi:hypothetical protein
MPEPLALPSAGSRPPVELPAVEPARAIEAAEIAPAWHDLVEPADNLPAVRDRAPALSPDDLPAPPQELSLARRDSVVPRQATSREQSWDFSPWGAPPASPWGAPPAYDPADVWDSTTEHTFSWGLADVAVRVPRQAIPPADEPLGIASAPAIFEASASLDKAALADRVASLEDRYLTPAGPLTPGLGPVRRLRGTVKVARYAALSFIALLGIAAVVSQPHGPKSAGDLANSSQSILDDRAKAGAADRSQERSASPSATASKAASAATAKAKATAKASPKPAATKKATAAALPLVAGMDKAQMTNARTIVQTGQKLGIPSRGLLIGLMTAMQESTLYNQASAAVPESFNYPHQGDSVDYDSCGLFQQRTSMGWGTVKQIMDPVYSSTKFFTSLKQVSGWQSMELTLAAQAVQGSAVPYAYAKHESTARAILAALT